MEELENGMAHLKLYGRGEGDVSREQVSKSLDVILKQLSETEENKCTLVQTMVQQGIVDTISLLLKASSRMESGLIAKVAEVIAELAKTSSTRQPLTESSVIGDLLDLLSNEDNNVVLQTCRALGNICYDNDVARSIVKEKHGSVRLVNLLQRFLDMGEMPENLRTVASGCLLNLTEANEEAQEQALKAGIVELLLKYLAEYYNDEDLAMHCLLVLNCLADSEIGRLRLMDKAALQSLLAIFEEQLSEDVLETLLELFGSLLENDAVKLQLTEMGFCEQLMKLQKRCVERDFQEDSQSLMKMMCDLVILTLTGDSSMEYLYQDGKGSIYKETLEWMLASDEALQVSGALAAGNFARKDEHCIQMVKDGIAKRLLDLLEKHASKDGDIRLQHAVLSALRNLAIPAINKPLLVQMGTLERILPMIEVETFPVVFKLLGTFRMLVDKQEAVAVQLGENVAAIQRIVSWCSTDDHPGVKGEATRLLAWILQNSKSLSVMKTLLSQGALPHLIAMVSSEHTVMQNEAILAMIVLCSEMLDAVEGDLQKNGIASVILLLKNAKSPPEVTSNLLAFLLVLCGSDAIKQELASSGLTDTLAVLEGSGDGEVKERSEMLKRLLEVP